MWWTVEQWEEESRSKWTAKVVELGVSGGCQWLVEEGRSLMWERVREDVALRGDRACFEWVNVSPRYNVWPQGVLTVWRLISEHRKENSGVYASFVIICCTLLLVVSVGVLWDCWCFGCVYSCASQMITHFSTVHSNHFHPHAYPCIEQTLTTSNGILQTILRSWSP